MTATRQYNNFDSYPPRSIVMKQVAIIGTVGVPACLFFVMLFARKDIYCIISDFVNNSVLIIDSSRPIAGKFVLERLWLSYSDKWISGNVFYEIFDSLENLFVCGFPIVVVFVSRFIKSNDCNQHALRTNYNAASSIFFTFPFSISLSPSRRISLFTGLLKRYSVSSIDVSSASALSVTVMSRVVPENIFLRPSKNSMVNSVFLSVNELCIRTSVFYRNYTHIPQKLLLFSIHKNQNKSTKNSETENSFGSGL